MTFQGNCVSEWFGHRVYPVVVHDADALADQRAGRCPFLSSATREERRCIKTPSAFGVCTISSSSNGPRQDWLVCPYRAVEPSLLSDAVERLFGPAEGSPYLIVPAPALLREEARSAILSATASGGSAIVFLQDKLGGEISLAKTHRSPELSFDITLVEIRGSGGGLPDVSRYGILEVQTMDFHGS